MNQEVNARLQELHTTIDAGVCAGWAEHPKSLSSSGSSLQLMHEPVFVACRQRLAAVPAGFADAALRRLLLVALARIAFEDASSAAHEQPGPLTLPRASLRDAAAGWRAAERGAQPGGVDYPGDSQTFLILLQYIFLWHGPEQTCTLADL